ncbi:hypothetical protein BKI52_31895 [marine bacterium AO1-C]|nr:hypothetical protein BKI52_31895 [marine bacterium AO1-C]
MEKFINSIEEEKNKQLYSINFLLAELHEHTCENESKKPLSEIPATKPPTSSQYNTNGLDTYNFYKPIATTLTPMSIQLLKEKEI